MRIKEHTLYQKWLCDDKGKLAIFQMPNPPLLFWFVSMIARQLTHGHLELLFSLIAFGALFTWAWLEIFSGVNYFRRAFGCAVLIALLVGAVGRGGI